MMPSNQMPTNNYFVELAAKARAGDIRAQGQFQRELEPHLARIVARALDPNAAPTPVHRMIRALSHQLRLNPDAGPLERQRFTQMLCRRAADRLAPRDTATFGGLESFVA